MRIFELTTDEIVSLAEAATRADCEGKTFKFAVRGDGLIYKIGGGMWSPGQGVEVDG